MDKKPLTERQQEILDYIQDYTAAKGFAPSIREICNFFDISSTRGVHRHLETLEEKGRLKRESTPRSIKIIQDGISDAFSKTVELPMLGFIAAGAPIEVMEQQETMDVPSALVGKKPCYVLKVKGNSMIEDHILNGDFIVIEKCETADDGEVVVALINNRSEATLKRLYREKSRIRLQPANSELKPIYVKDIAIQGKVRGLFRKF
jgi:repressor LexA